MSENVPVKFLSLLFFIYVIYLIYGALTAGSMSDAKTACDKAVADRAKLITDKYSDEANKAESEMLVACKAMKQKSELHLKPWELNP
jgi:zona occludens toxin (predicted ATPase)